MIDTQNERSVIDTLSESAIDTKANMCAIDTQNENMCDRYTK